MTNDILLLKIRNLIVSRELNVAEANRETQHGDGWLCDHSYYDRQLREEIEELFKIADQQNKE